MLSRQATHALKALLLLAAEPQAWQSTHALAVAQQLPEPMLEQLLLRLRRAGLLVARRGRTGGYRLTQLPRQITVAAVIAALGDAPGDGASALSAPSTASAVSAEVSINSGSEGSAADQVTQALARRLECARQKALEALTLEDLLFDLRSAEASRDEQGGLLLG